MDVFFSFLLILISDLYFSRWRFYGFFISVLILKVLYLVWTIKAASVGSGVKLKKSSPNKDLLDEH